MIRSAALPRRARGFRFFRSVAALILREMGSTYGRSPGGYIWAILEPVAGVALLTLVFSIMLRAPLLGSNFPYFYASGFLVFMLYSAVAGSLMSAVRYSRQLLEYPSVTIVDALVARFLLAAFTQLLVMAIIMSGIIWWFDLRPILTWSAIANALGMATAFGVAVGVSNCFLISMYPLWERVWAVLNRPVFLVSGIIFLPENVPERFRDLLMWNPLMHITSEMRRGVYGIYDAVHVDPVYVYGLSFFLGLLGLYFLLNYHKDIVLR
ncbi:ABC transporter permease [Jannaschia rubra]|uniref:Polysialic acid transport protein KpsM n=1 Tax=Jannaschia rubra TaxID=282197 RepID=A0A0M6XT76_9RHOB|nr:ABC transporter permease [Jannaschia rubra]CTQ33194.1 Polysialic acid transport protein KpsM [Jannaschia rubra]SFF96691.1 capsular polysaccharide transport system permease protein [Jannaschia rubra]